MGALWKFIQVCTPVNLVRVYMWCLIARFIYLLYILALLLHAECHSACVVSGRGRKRDVKFIIRFEWQMILSACLICILCCKPKAEFMSPRKLSKYIIWYQQKDIFTLINIHSIFIILGFMGSLWCQQNRGESYPLTKRKGAEYNKQTKISRPWTKETKSTVFCCYSFCLCAASNKICNLSAARPHIWSIHSVFVATASHVGRLPCNFKSRARRLNQSSDAWKLIIKHHPLANTQQQSITQLRWRRTRALGDDVPAVKRKKQQLVTCSTSCAMKPMRLLV